MLIHSKTCPKEGIAQTIEKRLSHKKYYTYSWASLVTQTVKNPPATRETWVRSLGLESPGERHGNPLQYSCLENPIDREPWGCKESDTTERLNWTEKFPGLGRSPGGGHGYHSSILAWRIPPDRGARQATVHGITKSQTWLSDFHCTVWHILRYSGW